MGKNKELIKIAITGSSGKTSVKNYLEKMLKTTYRVLATPLSFNTPLGVCKTVKEDICDYDIFIAEMGARRKNDIKELCNMVEPEIGIITTILPQHTKTLGGISGVKNAKYQLIEGLTKQKTGFFYNDNSHLYDLYKKADCNKRLVGEGGEVYFKNAVQLADGIDFELVVSGNTYKTFTPLIGFHNLKNVCIATAVALHVGVRLSKIMSVIQNLSPPKHRAEIIKTPTGVIVIDDGYNANIDGICSTANAVGQMEIGAGGKKIAVTCGIVELGKEAKELNFKVGEVLAKNFTQIIAIGINSIDVEKGVNGSGGNCLVLSDMKSVKRYFSKSLNKGDIVAFFNDLPDVYGI